MTVLGVNFTDRIDKLIASLPPLTDEDRRQAVAILSSVNPADRRAA